MFDLTSQAIHNVNVDNRVIIIYIIVYNREI
jgi:hypothetical protein